MKVLKAWNKWSFGSCQESAEISGVNSGLTSVWTKPTDLKTQKAHQKKQKERAIVIGSQAFMKPQMNASCYQVGKSLDH
jgi:hypothetical protein